MYKQAYDLAALNSKLIPKNDYNEFMLDLVLRHTALDFQLFCKVQAFRLSYPDVYVHSINVARSAIDVGYLLMADTYILAFASVLHDIGKMTIPRNILYKAGKLNNSEIEIMNKHPENGYSLLSNISSIKKEISNIVLCHHVHVDGSGYPEEMLKFPISLENQVVTACDMYVALREARSYKNGSSHTAAIALLRGSLSPLVDQSIINILDMQYKTQIEAA